MISQSRSGSGRGAELLSEGTLYRTLRQSIRAAETTHKAFSLVLLELTDYAALKRIVGADCADRFLHTIAERVLHHLPPGTVVGRVGTGELVFVDHQSLDDQRVHLMLEAAAQHLDLDGRPLSPVPRAGIATFPQHGTRVETLLRRARLAASTGSERPTLRAYTPAIEAHAQREFALRHELSDGLAAGQLNLRFQPQIRLADLQVESCEALVRWRHPEHGPLVPDQFIEAAERNGDIHELGSWVLDQACAQLALWRQSGSGIERIAINISPVELGRRDFARQVVRTIERHGLPPRAITLEITESVSLGHSGAALDQVHALDDAGVRIAIDDFGSGYSAITTLQHLPAETLKLDRALTRDLAGSQRARTLIRSAINLGHDLGMRVVAEGVETPEQQQILTRLYCDCAQGFLFGRPLQPGTLNARHPARQAGGFNHPPLAERSAY